jgi:hypothetical protein
LSPRLFASILGVIAILAGLIGMGAEINIYAEGEHANCGTVFNHEADIDGVRQDDQLGSLVGPDTDRAGACEDAVGDRKMWMIPLAVVGVVVLLGGILIRTRPSIPTPI